MSPPVVSPPVVSDGASLRETLEAAARTLDAAGIDDPRREVQVLVGHALGIGREVLLAEPARGLACALAFGAAACAKRRPGN